MRKIDLSAFTSSRFKNCRNRVLFFRLSAYRLWILLVSPPARSLRTQPHLVQQSAKGTSTQTGTKGLVVQLPGHARSPQCEAKVHLHRVFHRHRIIRPLQSLTVKLRRPLVPFARTKILSPSRTIQRQPTKHRSKMDSKHIGNNSRAFPNLHSRDCALSRLRQRLVIECCAICFHKRTYHKAMIFGNYFRKVNKVILGTEGNECEWSFVVKEFQSISI
jgi:hypothetical protein